MKRSVYVVLAEVSPLAGCELDPKVHNGAMVRCYVLATSSEDAQSRTTDALTRDKFALVQVEWCAEADTTEWENAEDADAKEFIDEAARSGSVVYGRFDTWNHDASDPIN